MALKLPRLQEPPAVESRWFDSGPKYRRWLDLLTKDQQQAFGQLGLATVIATPTYGSTISINLAQGGIQKIIVTNSHNFTISAPTNIGQLANWELIILNSSGGAMGTVTFDPSIHQSGLTNPANGQRVTSRFYIEPGSTPEHYQIGNWSAAL